VNIGCLVRDAARNYPAAHAVSGAGHIMDYRELWTAACNLAKGLRAAGVGPGDRVALMMTNCPEFLVSLVGCLAGGFVAVPVNCQLHASELEYILRHSGAAAVIFTADHGAKVATATATATADLQCRLVTAGDGLQGLVRAGERQHGWSGLADDLTGQEPGWLFYTSGTTGRPKGATLTHANLLAMVRAFEADIAELGPQDRLLHLAPLSHGSGLYALPALVSGAANIIGETGHFDGLSPVMLTRLARGKGDARLPGLRLIVYGGAPIRYPDVSLAVRELGAILVQIYGQGEAPMTITSLSAAEHQQLVPDASAPDAPAPDAPAPDASAPDAPAPDASAPHSPAPHPLVPAGRPRTGVDVGLTETGEVRVRGDVVMSGYWEDPAATATALRDGWLHTGDVGRMDGDGMLTLVDRANDMIISGGLNVYPSEVEVVLQAHPAVREAVVFAVPDEDWGEIVAAAVVAEPGPPVTEKELSDWCKQHIASFKKPRAIRFVDALPRNAYGKVLRREARAAWKPRS
jgi:long-chain acyl-CoA synthetase